MEDTYRTKQYLKEMEAVLIEEKVKIGSICNSKIPVFTRKYYKKRNNKICFVDCNIKVYDVDWSKVRNYKTQSQVYINDYNNKIFTNYSCEPTKIYKGELIKQYNYELNRT